MNVCKSDHVTAVTCNPQPQQPVCITGVGQCDAYVLVSPQHSLLQQGNVLSSYRTEKIQRHIVILSPDDLTLECVNKYIYKHKKKPERPWFLYEIRDLFYWFPEKPGGEEQK